MIVGFGSVKGSPGATTLAVVSGALWPHRRRLLLELDADGASLATRFPSTLKAEPTVVQMLADCRHRVDEEAVRRHTQLMPFGFDVIVGSGAPALAERANVELIERLPALCEAMGDTDVLCDIGRLRPGTSSFGLAAGLDAIVVAVRPNFEGLEPLFRRLPDLVSLAVPIVVVTIGASGFAADELDAELRSRSNGGAALGGHVPHDPKAAAGWNGTGGWLAPRSARRLQRTGLATATHKLVQQLSSGRARPTPPAPDLGRKDFEATT